MKSSLIPAAFLSVLATVLVLLHCGWLSPRSCRAASPPRQGPGRTHVEDAFSSSTAQQWRSCQPRHWRTCLLQGK